MGPPKKNPPGLWVCTRVSEPWPENCFDVLFQLFQCRCLLCQMLDIAQWTWDRQMLVCVDIIAIVVTSDIFV